MKIIVDAMGGDNAPKEIILGAIRAAEDFNIEIDLVGRTEDITPYLDGNSNIEIIDAREVISNDESPVSAVRHKKDSSMIKSFKLLKNKRGAAMISAGSTGALMAGGLLQLGRLKGIDRPAIAVTIPTIKNPVLLLDAGANSEVKIKNLLQFAIMGDIYMREVVKREDPKIALLNIGTEEEKGTKILKTAYTSLKQMKEINFIGNIEARDFFEGKADVILCDGFVGNIFIKTIEGFGSYLYNLMRDKVKKDEIYAKGAKIMAPAIEGIKSQLDYSEYGGAILLGLDGIIVKCHGSSDNKAIYNGIKVAVDYAKTDIQIKLKENLKQYLKGDMFD